MGKRGGEKGVAVVVGVRGECGGHTSSADTPLAACNVSCSSFTLCFLQALRRDSIRVLAVILQKTAS